MAATKVLRMRLTAQPRNGVFPLKSKQRPSPGTVSVLFVFQNGTYNINKSRAPDI